MCEGGSSARHADITEEVKRCPHGTAIPMTVTTMTRPERRRDNHGWPSPPDPGDLSRRVAQRRAELHLTQAQVAARAGLSLRYLEYLERYPARPAPAALRQLAAALRTTPAALLGAGRTCRPASGAKPTCASSAS
jgi:DNA-binding XRE family transcriptional regulator